MMRPLPLHVRTLERCDWKRTLQIGDELGLVDAAQSLSGPLPQRSLLIGALSTALARHLKEVATQCGLMVATQALEATRARYLLVSGAQDALERWENRLRGTAKAVAKLIHEELHEPPPLGTLELPCGALRLDRGPLVQAIINVTPDSFFDGGRYQGLASAVARAERAVEEGADLLDVGGESTRPGAEEVSEVEECARVLPVIEALAKRLNVPVSVDTVKSGVARRAVEAGAQIINDVSAMTRDRKMVEVAARSGVGIILMHMRGTPATMQEATNYTSLMGQIKATLRAAVEYAEEAGIPRNRLIVDPGIGFAKTADQNLVILKELGALKSIGCPILVGASRKSYLGRLFGWQPEERLFGSVASAASAVLSGAHIVRVHDVLETRQVVDTVWQIQQAGSGESPLTVGLGHVRRHLFEHSAE